MLLRFVLMFQSLGNHGSKIKKENEHHRLDQKDATVPVDQLLMKIQVTTEKVFYCYRNYPLKPFLSMIMTMIVTTAVTVITKIMNVDKATNQPVTKSNEAAGSKCGETTFKGEMLSLVSRLRCDVQVTGF